MCGHHGYGEGLETGGGKNRKTSWPRLVVMIVKRKNGQDLVTGHDGEGGRRGKYSRRAFSLGD